MGKLGWPKCVGMLGWFKWVGVLGWLGLACPPDCTCLFKVRPGVLCKMLSHMWGKLDLPIFLFNGGLFTLMNNGYFKSTHLGQPNFPTAIFYRS